MKFNYELSDELSNLFMPWEFEKSNTSKQIIMLPIKEQDVNIEFQNALKEVGLFVNSGRIFHIDSTNIYAIHIDEKDPYPNRFAKINYVIGGTDSYMNWFKLKEGKDYHRYVDPYGDVVFGFKWDECEEISRAHIPENRCSLIDAGTPHSLTNKVDFRTSYSMVLKDITTGQYVEFDDARQRLKKYINE
jgi:hypothetical protein